MNEIIKGMANASEAIQENFEEQGEKITAVEQNIDLLTDKVRGFVVTPLFQQGAAVIPMSELGDEAPNKFIWQASMIRSVSAGVLAIAIEPASTALNIYLRTMDNTSPANAVYAVHLLRYG